LIESETLYEKMTLK